MLHSKPMKKKTWSKVDRMIASHVTLSYSDTTQPLGFRDGPAMSDRSLLCAAQINTPKRTDEMSLRKA